MPTRIPTSLTEEEKENIQQSLNKQSAEMGELIKTLSKQTQVLAKENKRLSRLTIVLIVLTVVSIVMAGIHLWMTV